MKSFYLTFSKNRSILFIFLFLFSSLLHAQDLLEEIDSSISLGGTEAKFSETIRIISRSGKIFIISNSNQLLSKGDFLTMSLKDGGPVARAVVAKAHDGQVGIKVLKVYSLKRWAQTKKNNVIDITKGDDSALFQKKADKNQVASGEASIDSEEDLFNEKAILREDISDFYQDNRHIKPDNIVTAAYSQLRFEDHTRGQTTAGNQFYLTWAYQFSDNFWVEGLYGRTAINSFPDDGSQMIINNLTARVKYAFKAPLYSYVLPYIGVKTASVSTVNGTGEDRSGGTIPGQLAADQEKKTVTELSQTKIIMGVTLLRRLVPGWFLKVDLGTNIIGMGFGIEF
ncbi:MAG: hypothetical protein HON90_13675 [Halobacteriovoraceae bacterium]|jgi:hypothetical protein|nr:hypothetical protein [Halobacteriovoraceae bacterium]